jgi:hypothetical protein
MTVSQLVINLVGVEKVTVIRTLNGSKSMVKEGEISLPCFVGSPFSEAR